MDDELGKIIRRQLIPQQLSRKSLENGIKIIDKMLYEQGQKDKSILDPNFLRTVRSEAERVLRQGYNYGKMSVLVPVGLWGVTQGIAAPDLDISLLGIGNHRFFLFHSALGLVVLRHFYNIWRQGEQDPSKWTSRALHKVAAMALGTYAMGVGVHLTIDAFQPKSIVFPFFGSLLDGTLIDDNIWLLGNALWAFKISRDIFALTLAGELESAKTYVTKNFALLREGPALRKE